MSIIRPSFDGNLVKVNTQTSKSHNETGQGWRWDWEWLNWPFFASPSQTKNRLTRFYLNHKMTQVTWLSDGSCILITLLRNSNEYSELWSSLWQQWLLCSFPLLMPVHLVRLSKWANKWHISPHHSELSEFTCRERNEQNTLDARGCLHG